MNKRNNRLGQEGGEGAGSRSVEIIREYSQAVYSTAQQLSGGIY